MTILIEYNSTATMKTMPIQRKWQFSTQQQVTTQNKWAPI